MTCLRPQPKDSSKERDNVYISGPMSGKKEHNRPAFAQAAAALTKQGYAPLDPTQFEELPAGSRWVDYLKKDLRLLSYASGLMVLPGWEDSVGATLEVDIAFRLGMPVHKQNRYTKGLGELIMWKPGILERKG